MGLSSRDVAAAVARAYARSIAVEAELNAADARLGDGDTGITVRRVLQAMAEAPAEAGDDLGAYFRALSSAAAGATGSSLGTLMVVGLTTFAKGAKGETAIAWGDLGARLSAVRDALLARGGAALGDKTVVDMLDAVASVINGIDEPKALSHAAHDAAAAALEAFRDRECRMGRARMFRERSVGADDPGMLAFARLLDGVTGSVRQE